MHRGNYIYIYIYIYKRCSRFLTSELFSTIAESLFDVTELELGILDSGRPSGSEEDVSAV